MFICCVEVVVVANQNRALVYLANQSNGNGRPFQNLHNLNQRNVLSSLTKINSAKNLSHLLTKNIFLQVHNLLVVDALVQDTICEEQPGNEILQKRFGSFSLLCAWRSSETRCSVFQVELINQEKIWMDGKEF